jgi:hypothetical protein
MRAFFLAAAIPIVVTCPFGRQIRSSELVFDRNHTAEAGHVFIDPVALDRLSDQEVTATLSRLEASRELGELERLGRMPFRQRSQAIRRYVRSCGSQEAIRYCERFSVGTEEWEAAFFAFRSRCDKDTVAYVKRCAGSPSAAIRGYCYMLAKSADWPGFEEFAMRDANEQAVVRPFTNVPLDECTVGYFALQYLKASTQWRK